MSFREVIETYIEKRLIDGIGSKSKSQKKDRKELKAQFYLKMVVGAKTVAR